MAERRGRGRNGATSEGSFLHRWKARAAERRVKLREVLAQPPGDAAKSQARLLWLQRTNNAIATRRAWLEARLEHVIGLQAILEGALTGVPPVPGERPDDGPEYSPDDLIADPETNEYPRRG
ncbi:MAG TPA: hypothetical protein VLW65_22315 [Bryobacteraceae bacterium]|nr:hypothetical protein [Bryobacteraceae bacterium]